MSVEVSEKFKVGDLIEPILKEINDTYLGVALAVSDSFCRVYWFVNPYRRGESICSTHLICALGKKNKC
ncbi:MAG: hypothetical protein Q8P81_02230 [Nanoarchaeota archaeon]|nr:hypothetical protein [Nanoarchaeota archaeon]